MKEIYRCRYTVTIGDINYGGHLGHDKSLLIFQDARIRLFSSQKCSEMDIGGGIGLVVAESGCRYLKEVFLHEELEIVISLEKSTEKTVTLKYTLSKEGEEQTALEGFTVLVAYDYRQKKAVPIPSGFLAEFR